MRFLPLVTFYLFLLPHSSSASGAFACDNVPSVKSSKALRLSATEHLRADRMISVFENSTMEFQYGYCDNIHDGCGYTVGRIGFCTSQGDLLEVVEDFTKLEPNNPLAKYLPKLKVLAASKSESTKELEGFPEAVKRAALDSNFKKIQDKKVEELEYRPALQFSDKLELTLKLSLAEIYQAGVQLGWGNEATSVPMISQQAEKLVIAKYGRWIEACWLEAFMTLHRNALKDSPIEAARGSIGRADTMLQLYHQHNFDFHGPIDIAPYDPQQSFHIP